MQIYIVFGWVQYYFAYHVATNMQSKLHAFRMSFSPGHCVLPRFQATVAACLSPWSQRSYELAPAAGERQQIFRYWKQPRSQRFEAAQQVLLLSASILGSINSAVIQVMPFVHLLIIKFYANRCYWENDEAVEEVRIADLAAEFLWIVMICIV